jgi:hydrogenase/urease accessory protein HupE
MAQLVLQPSQLLLVLGLVLLAAQGGAACRDRLPLLLPGAWLLGGLVGQGLGVEQLQAVACTALVTAIGLLTALGVRLGPWAFLLVCAGTAMPVALVTGSAMAGHRDAVAALLGQVVAIAVLVAVLLLPLAPPQPRWLAIGLRVAGSWIAAAGLMMLAWLARHPQ